MWTWAIAYILWVYNLKPKNKVIHLMMNSPIWKCQNSILFWKNLKKNQNISEEKNLLLTESFLNKFLSVTLRIIYRKSVSKWIKNVEIYVRNKPCENIILYIFYIEYKLELFFRFFTLDFKFSHKGREKYETKKILVERQNKYSLNYGGVCNGAIFCRYYTSVELKIITNRWISFDVKTLNCEKTPNILNTEKKGLKSSWVTYENTFELVNIFLQFEVWLQYFCEIFFLVQE